MIDSKQVLSQAFEAHKKNDIDTAKHLYEKLLESGFHHDSVINNLAAIYTENGQFDLAISILNSSEKINSSALLQSGLAAAYKLSGDLEKSIEHATMSLEIDPDQPDTWNNLGSSLRNVGRWDEAILALNEASARRPNFSLALFNLGNAYLEKRDLITAIHYYNRAIDANPEYANAYVNLGNCYRELRDYSKAEDAYNKAFSLDGALFETQFNIGIICIEQNRFTDAIHYFSNTLISEKFRSQTIPHLIGATQKIGEWNHTDLLIDLAVKAIREGSFIQCPPFNLISLVDDPELMFAANKLYTQTYIKPPEITPPSRLVQSRKIKLAYFSNDIHDHATGYLIAELFELHNFDLFEIALISYGPNTKKSTIRERIINSNVFFVEASLWSDPQIIDWISSNEIQILIDLKGYTSGCRPQVLAQRPAPIQIQYLGYPSTMGAEFIDYFIGDHETLPVGIEKYFSEQLIRLPGCYQVNDSKREISKHVYTREEFGLPENAVVFASFNSSYKITKEMWQIWMSILAACPNSVLWLLADNEWISQNLVSNAINLGIDERRLVFAEKLSNPEHLSRLSLADLCLDTYPCCGHTTTSDALFAGLPVITLEGRSFHSRVSASLLKAQGLDHLVTKTIGEYATTAVTYASNQETLDTLKQECIHAKTNGVLYNTPLWVRNFENALIEVLSNR